METATAGAAGSSSSRRVPDVSTLTSFTQLIFLYFVHEQRGLRDSAKLSVEEVFLYRLVTLHLFYLIGWVKLIKAQRVVSCCKHFQHNNVRNHPFDRFEIVNFPIGKLIAAVNEEMEIYLPGLYSKISFLFQTTYN